MSSHRIIRPTDNSEKLTVSPMEINLEDIQLLTRDMLREAREKVREAEDRRDALEAEIARGHEEAERQLAALKESVEREIAEIRNSLTGEVESARENGIARGREEGFVEGEARGRDEGFRKGFEEGYSEGREAGYRDARQVETQRIREEVKPLFEAIRATAEEISKRRFELLEAARKELLHLAVEIARKILQRDIQAPGRAVLTSVGKAIDMVFLRSKIVVQIHPEDMKAAEKYVIDILERLGGFQEYEIREMEDVGRGGCRVVSGNGQVDLSIDTQLDVIEQALMGCVQGEEAWDLSTAESRGEISDADSRRTVPVEGSVTAGEERSDNHEVQEKDSVPEEVPS